MKKRLEYFNKGIGASKARPGMGLPSALVIVLVCGMLVVVLFNISASFTTTAVRQQEVYADHARAASYIEQMKGMISKRCSILAADKEPVLHRPGYRSNGNHEKIRSSADLQITRVFADGDASLDVPVPNSYPSQRARVRVFDVGYKMADLAEEFLADGGASAVFRADLTAAQKLTLEDMPPPLTLAGVVVDSYKMKEVGQFESVQDKSKGPNDETEELNMDKIGIYVIRVELLDAASGRLIRFLEEAFYQVAPAIKEEA